MGKFVCAYLGNFTARASDGSRFNTEAHISETLSDMGHSVVELQENEVDLPTILAACRGADLLLWTKTGNWLKCNGFEMLSRVKIPTVGIHLDRWYGLNREGEVRTSPFFSCRFVFTADGDSDAKFKADGVNHHWLNPGVLKSECYLGTPRDDLRCDVGFTGSYNYHSEHYRKALIDWLRSTYGDRFRLFGANGDSWRGKDLNDLYASVKVMVGDSCFADKCKNYVSDRGFESPGRGASLAMPRIEGIYQNYTDGIHLRYYKPGDFGDLKRVIDEMMAMTDAQRLAMRTAAVAHTREHHTYHNRLAQLLSVVAAHEPAIMARKATP